MKRPATVSIWNEVKMDHGNNLTEGIELNSSDFLMEKKTLGS